MSSATRYQCPAWIDLGTGGKFGVLAEYPLGPDGQPRGFRFIGRENLDISYWDGE